MLSGLLQLNFAGEYIRSSAVVGAVVAADAAMSGGDSQPETLGGVTVTLEGEHAAGETMETDANGGFAFTGLRAGTYTVTISDYPEDVSFETVSVEVEVEVGEVGNADFTGHFIRTSAVEGRVFIEGEGLPGVTVTLNGGPADESYTAMTDADGMYRFEDLRPGDYTVSISDFDARNFEFASTSQDVSVDLDETGTVSFTGVNLRTSGISGRVSVEGMGLGGVEVTLSGGEESRSATTDDGGQYSFAGLAAGDYTVSIAVESAAYVFESMSSDVTLGDDESAIVNFDGAHARTASVSGMAYLDEASKNDMYDEGEHPLAAAGIPVALVGPGVGEQRLGATDANGMFSFTGLRAETYQLVVLVDATVAMALAANDVAYGGEAAGYPLTVGVGEAVTQNVPFDITHTTVNVAVTLKGGDHRGQPVPGAAVTLYSDAAGETKVGGGETAAGEAGVFTSIKVARAGTTDNTVYMGVAAEGYFVDPTAEMQAVTWDPQSFTHPAPGAEVPAVLNDADIVNLGVDVSVGGATVTRGDMGGAALANWAIGVMSGADAENLAAVEGAPAMLDADGMASLKTTVTPDALPVTYHFGVVPDSIQADSLDGGESFEGTTVSHTHTGLMLAGTQDAGTIEVEYTTQTLKAYVHHERDQVHGYTGNVLGKDERDVAEKVELVVKYIDQARRARSFAKEAWDRAKNTTTSKGVTTFTGLPADANIIVQAVKPADSLNIMLLSPDELAAWTAPEMNGITGGMFGEMGGYGHTVELCPLEAVDPTDQYYGECGSFAYVDTHAVSGMVWRRTVETSDKHANDDDFTLKDSVAVVGIDVDLDPVEGKNLGGDLKSYTTEEKDDSETSLDERSEFDFGRIAAGVYALSVEEGWRARVGGYDATTMVSNTFNPLAMDVVLDVTPATGTVYGYVRDTRNEPVSDVTVSVNGVDAVTDRHGRYIADGFGAETRTISKTKHTDKVFVETAHKGSGKTRAIIDFTANQLIRQDIELSGLGMTASVSGRITASGTGEPIPGVEIMVDGAAPSNKATKGANAGKLLTDTDGMYTAMYAAKEVGATAKVSASKAGWNFVPAEQVVPAHGDAEVSGINFTGFLHAKISGRVRGPDDMAMGGIKVTATSVADTTDVTQVTNTDDARGTFVLSVPFGVYDIEAEVDPEYTLKYPNDNQRVSVAPGQDYTYGIIRAMTFAANSVEAYRQKDTADVTNIVTYDGDFTVTWRTGTINAGHSVDFEVQTKFGTGDWSVAGSRQDITVSDMTLSIPDLDVPDEATGAAFFVRVKSTSDNGPGASGDDIPVLSDSVSVAVIDPSASSVGATRGVDGEDNDTIGVTWSAITGTGSDFRIVMELQVSDTRTEWLVSPNSDPAGSARSWNLDITGYAGANWPYADGTGGPGIAVTEAILRKALKVAVESLQGNESDTNKWKRSEVKSLDAKPASSGSG